MKREHFVKAVEEGKAMKVEGSNAFAKRQLTPPYARYLVHLIRPFPDFDFSFIKPLRRKAVQRECLVGGENK